MACPLVVGDVVVFDDPTQGSSRYVVRSHTTLWDEPALTIELLDGWNTATGLTYITRTSALRRASTPREEPDE